jgi:hypothetical protein
MNRRVSVVVTVVGTAAVVVSFLVPPDFAWNGLNTLNFCIATSHYASGPLATLAWFGFAAAALYPYVWVVIVAIATLMEWNGSSKVAPLLPAFATTVGNCLISALGVLLLLMRENWPSPSIQWVAAAVSLAHTGILWSVVRGASPERRTAAVILVGAIPFVFLQIALAVTSWRYANPVLGFALAAAGATTLLVTSCVLLLRRVS